MIRKVKLKDVAARAGVAVNTASTILNRRPNSWASKETEARVFQAARDLGYRPNRTARALQSGRYHQLGILIQDYNNPYFMTMADEFEAVAEELGYGLLVENCRSSLVRERQLLEDLDDLEVDGVVVWLSDNEAYRHDLGERFGRHLPVVAFCNGLPDPPLPVDAVISDFTDGLRAAVDELCALGHRRFAFLSAIAEGQSHGGRPDLLREMLAGHGIPADSLAVVSCGHSLESAARAFAAFLAGQAPADRPTALVGMNDLSAIGAMRAATEAGLTIPRDLSVVGVDDIPLAGYLPVALSSIRQRYRKITRAAAELLTSRLEADVPPPPRQVVFPTRFIRRESVGPAPTQTAARPSVGRNPKSKIRNPKSAI
jgi:LacI family transcriptional regulator